MTDTKYVTCPFCKEDDFDLIGLKYHLVTYCEIFPEIISAAEETGTVAGRAEKMTRFRTSKRRITHYGTVAIGETPFQASIIQMAELRGYRAYHVANVKGQLRNETAVGFQDMIIAGKGMIIFAENKSETGQLSAEQKEWYNVISECQCPQVHAKVWRPRHFDEIDELLK